MSLSLPLIGDVPNPFPPNTVQATTRAVLISIAIDVVFGCSSAVIIAGVALTTIGTLTYAAAEPVFKKLAQLEGVSNYPWYHHTLRVLMAASAAKLIGMRYLARSVDVVATALISTVFHLATWGFNSPQNKAIPIFSVHRKFA